MMMLIYNVKYAYKIKNKNNIELYINRVQAEKHAEHKENGHGVRTLNTVAYYC